MACGTNLGHGHARGAHDSEFCTLWRHIIPYSSPQPFLMSPLGLPHQPSAPVFSTRQLIVATPHLHTPHSTGPTHARSEVMPSRSGVVLPKSIPIFGNVPNGTSHISSTIGVQLENSSDLSLGRRPDSKSDEFSSCTPMVDEIFMFLRLKPLKSCYTVWEHDPASSGPIRHHRRSPWQGC
jgi:hypothetical protein